MLTDSRYSNFKQISYGLLGGKSCFIFYIDPYTSLSIRCIIQKKLKFRIHGYVSILPYKAVNSKLALFTFLIPYSLTMWEPHPAGRGCIPPVGG